MGSVTVNVRIRGSRGETLLKAIIDTGFYGDIITTPKKVDDLGTEFKYERIKRLPNGEAIRVRYGVGEVEVMGEATGGDIEIYPELKLPEGVDALLGVTSLEKMGFKVDHKMGRLEKVELFLL